MNKRTKVLIILGVICVFLLNLFLYRQMMQKKVDYTGDLTTDEQKEVVETTLSFITDKDLRNDIESNIDVNKFYEELKEIHNYEYSSKLTSYLTQVNNALKEKGTTLSEVYNDGESIQELLNLYCGQEFIDFTHAYLIGEDKNEEYPEESGDRLYFALLEKFTNANYDSIKSEFDNLLATYKFTESYNYRIANLYHDMQILSSKNSLDSSELLSTLYDPSVYVIQTMSLFPEDRYEIIEDKSVPLIQTSVAATIQEVNIETVSITSDNYKDMYKRVFNRYVSATDDPLYTLDVVKITFTDGTDVFDAYVAINVDKSCNLYTIVPQNTEKTYQTLSQKIEEIREQNEEKYGNDDE